jgi:poly-gamma-glutamate synthesis protein (capsule biosynthesis protein)
VEKKGIKIAFLSYTTLTNGIKRKKKYELNVFDEKIVKKELEDAKKKSDIIIFSIHWGVEYSNKATKRQKKIANFLANNGVDIIIGTHPHVIEPVEKIKNTLVIYSLGNFISSQIGTDRRVGLMLSLDIEKEEKKITIKNIIPRLNYVQYTEDYKEIKIVPFGKINNSILSNYLEIKKNKLNIIGDVSEIEIIKDI